MSTPFYKYRLLQAADNSQFPPVPIPYLQRAGAITDMTVTYDKHPLTVKLIPEVNAGYDVNINTPIDPDTATRITVTGGVAATANPCFVMDYNRRTREATFIGLTSRNACFNDTYHDMRAVARIAYEVAVNYLGATSFVFTDNSHKECDDTDPPIGNNIDDDIIVDSLTYTVLPAKAKIRLANWSFLTTGQTWYESIFPAKCHPQDPYIREQLPEWRRRVSTNRWRDVAGPLLDVFDHTGIDIDAPGSAMEVMRRAKESRKFCAVIAANLRDLRIRSGVTKSLYNKSWIIYPMSISRRKGAKTRSRGRPNKPDGRRTTHRRPRP
jgi:hypothetical protein